MRQGGPRAFGDRAQGLPSQVTPPARPDRRGPDPQDLETRMISTILLIVLILLLIGALPAWPHSRGWGYYPSGGLGLVVIILLILLLMGYI